MPRWGEILSSDPAPTGGGTDALTIGGQAIPTPNPATDDHKLFCWHLGAGYALDQLSGDISGRHDQLSVDKVKGRTVPAGGNVGEYLRVASATAYEFGTPAGGGGTARQELVAQWDVSSTKTNIPTTFVDIYTQTNSDGKSVFIDTAGKTQVRLVVLWNKIGAGTQTVQALEVGTANVLASMNVVSGVNDTGLVNLPAAFVNAVKRVKLQAKSTNAADDPVLEGARLYLK